MSYYNTSTNHPIIDNAQEYTIEKKYVSIHSEDRNLLKFPNPSDFEIQLPQDYLNVSTIKLSTWSFPSNFDVFSPFDQNTVMTFQFINVYNPDISPDDQTHYAMQSLIYQFLTEYKNPLFNTKDFVVTIENGYYTPVQMANELTNRFNAVVTDYLSEKLILHDNLFGTTYNFTFLNYENGVITGGYTDFVISYNEVEEKLYFGNKSSSFSLTQNTDIINNYYSENNCVLQSHTLPDNLQPLTKETKETQKKDTTCSKKFNNNESIHSSFPDNYINGLPFYLGLNTDNLDSITVNEPSTNPLSIPRFYYKNKNDASDNGYWLVPNPSLPSSNVSYVVAPNKINLLGPSYFYLEIAGLNYIDETSPFNVSQFTIQRNETNGIVNSSFAKIGVTTTPLSQFYNNTILDMDSYKYFNPPAERIRKMKVKLRYHNGQYVNFNNSSFSFTLEFTLLKPQILRNMITSKSYTTL